MCDLFACFDLRVCVAHTYIRIQCCTVQASQCNLDVFLNQIRRSPNSIRIPLRSHRRYIIFTFAERRALICV
jgi:hypothetical protein